VNIIRGTGEIFEFSTDVNNVPEWINLYVSVYHDVSTANSVGDIAFEKEYSISAERITRETMAEKSEEIRRRKKRNKIS
jgi:hypothetical protein